MRALTFAIVALLLGVALAGCTTDTGQKPTPSTGTTPEGPTGATEAIVSLTPTAPRAGESVSFDAQGTTTADTVTWQFGDGADATGKTATHSYATPGAYIVRLEIKNARGTVHNEGALTYVTVSPDGSKAAAGPTAVVILDRQVVSKGGNVTANATGSYVIEENPDFNASIGETPDNPRFARNATQAAALTYEIDWGDGTKDAASNATHTYASSGLYVVTVTATGGGKTSRAAASVLVLAEGQPVGGYKHKDLYVEATLSGPQSFDPGFDYETAGGHVIEQVYDTLFTTERGNTERIVPLLAAEIPTVANGGIKEDGKVYVIKIRQNVKFHDGTLLDAAAVKFSLDRAILLNDPSSGAPVLAPILKGAVDYRRNSNNTQADRDAWLALEAVKVLDKHTVQITLDRPNAAFFQRLAFYGTSIVSPTAFKACHNERIALWGVCQTPDGLPPAATPGGRTITRDPWADANTVGTGPFKLRTWLPGDRVILDRNDAYFGAEKPKLKTVIIQYVDDLNTRILMFKSGDADEIYISSADLDRVKPSIEGIARFVPADTLIIDAFFFNYDVEDPAECPTVGGTPDCKLFQDIHVRMAMAHAFDYDSFFKDIWKGRAKSLAGVIPRGMPGYNDSLQPYKMDVEAAKTHLAMSKAKDGFTTSCTYNAGNTVRKGACELLKKNVEALGPGITINVRELPFNTLLDKSQQQQIPFWILGWAPDYIATDDYIEPFLHSHGNYPVQQNFHDTEMDAAIEKALAEQDPQKQARMYADINKMAVDKYVDIFLDQRTQTHVERTYVQGYYYSPLLSGSPNTGDYLTISKA